VPNLPGFKNLAGLISGFMTVSFLRRFFMSTEQSTDTLVLRQSTKEQRQIKWFLLSLPILLALAMYMTLIEDWTEILPKIQDDPISFFFIGLILMTTLALIGLIPLYRYQALKRERLILDADGIHYQSNLPWFLQGFLSTTVRDWSAQWTDITAIVLKSAAMPLGGSQIPIGRGPQFIAIGFHIGLRYHETFVCQWVTESETEEFFKSPREQQWPSSIPEPVKTALQDCPLIHYLFEKGLKIEVDPKLSVKKPFYQSDFALESNPYGLAAATFFFLLIAYTVFDLMFFLTETYTEGPMYYVYFFSGVGMAVFQMAMLMSAKVPKRESVIVALLVGGAFTVASHPGMLRFNQLTDTEGLKPYQYELQSDLSFEPVTDKTLPRLYLGDEEFWSTFEFGSIHEFELRKGALDFYQINLIPIEQLKAEAKPQTDIATEVADSTSYQLPNKELRTLDFCGGNVLSVAFSPDSKTVASGSKDKTIKLWEVNTGDLLQTLKAHQGTVQTLAFSPDGSLLASGSEDNTVKLWHIKEGKVKETLKEPPESFLTNLTEILKGEQKNLFILEEHQIFSVAFSPDGERLASGNWNRNILLWEVRSGNVLHFINGRFKHFWEPKGDEQGGHTDSVNSVAFSPDGHTLASGGFDKAIKLWDVETGTLLKTFKGHGDAVLSVTFSPDGNILASSGYDKSIKLWEIASGKILQTMRGHKKGVTSVSFNPDGQILASGSFDRTIKLWEVNSGKLLSTLKGHKDYVNAVVFSPDGHLIASASGDDTVKLWTNDNN
jgi:WD40 repeat protein